MTSETIDQVRTTGGCRNCLDVMDAFDRVLRDLDQDWDMVARRVASLAADSFIQFDMGLALDQINPGSVTVFTPDRGTPPDQVTGRYFRLSCQDGAAPCSGCLRLESLLAAEGFGKVTTFPLLEGDDCYGALLVRGDDADAIERATPFFQHIASRIAQAWGRRRNDVELRSRVDELRAEIESGRATTESSSDWFKQKLEDLRESQRQMARRLAYEQAVNECSRSLLEGQNEDESVVEALEALLRASGSNRVVLCTNDGTGFSTTLTHAVSTNRWSTERINDEHRQIPFDQGFFGVAGDLGQGEIITGSVVDMPAERTTSLKMLGLHSFALIPFFVLDEWTGFVGFGSDEDVSPWAEADLQLLRSAADMIGIYHERERMGRKIRRSEETTRALLNAPDLAAVLMDVHGVIIELNDYAAEFFDVSHETAMGTYLFEAMRDDLAEVFRGIHDEVLDSRGSVSRSLNLGRQFYEVLLFPVGNSDNTRVSRLAFYLRDVTDMKERDQQQAQDQRLASIGQLAAGIAHEINSPLQYIANYTQYLAEAFDEMKSLLEGYDAIMTEAERKNGACDLTTRAKTLVADADLEFLLEEVPNALKHTTDGVAWVTKIVRSMKELSHPDSSEMAPVDLNKAAENTLLVARNEWKYCAETECTVDPDLPLVTCMGGEINQVLLNLIVNAAHAIADTGAGQDDAPKGRIGIATRLDGDTAEIRVTDTGGGIPEDIRTRIFDPFFTTKDVGKGTGQGLAIAYNTVVKRHGGALTFETEPGVGTTFVLRIPVAGACDTDDA